MDSFRENVFLGLFWLFLKSESYDFDEITHTGATLGVDWLLYFIKTVCTVFREFELFVEMSGENRYERISSRNFIPTPKNRDQNRWSSSVQQVPA